MNVESLQRKILLMSMIGAILKIIIWVCLGWLGLEAIWHINDHGLKHLIETIWLGEI